MLQFALRGVENIHGVRQDSPPKMVSIDYELIVDTDETDQRPEFLHKNERKYGAISNKIAEVTSLVGDIGELHDRTGHRRNENRDTVQLNLPLPS